MFQEEELYRNAYNYWRKKISTEQLSPFTEDPLWNDHKQFQKWLLDNYKVNVIFKNLNIILQFSEEKDQILFVLKWS
jgi:hypothetical protein